MSNFDRFSLNLIGTLHVLGSQIIYGNRKSFSSRYKTSVKTVQLHNTIQPNGNITAYTWFVNAGSDNHLIIIAARITKFGAKTNYELTVYLYRNRIITEIKTMQNVRLKTV
jgi:hypothetical protein